MSGKTKGRRRRTYYDYRAAMVVYGFRCDPSEVSETLGLTPTKTRRKGERWGPNGIRVAKESSWTLYAGRTAKDSWEAQVVRLWSKIRRRARRFDKLPKGSRIQIGLYCTTQKERPWGYLPSRCLRTFGAIGAEFDIDVYDLSSVGTAMARRLAQINDKAVIREAARLAMEATRRTKGASRRGVP